MSRAATRSAVPTTRAAGLACLDVPADPGAPAGRPVLLVPGYTGSKEDFDPLLPLLAAAGHRAVAVDQVGQFESDGPDGGPDAEAAYTPDRLAEALLAAVDALGGGPWHLVGHSYGGLVARAAVLARRDAWASLVLLDSGPAAIPGARRRSTELLVQAVRALPLDQVWAGVTAYWQSQGHALPPEDAAAFQADRFTRSRAAAHAGMGDALLAEPDRVDALRALVDAGLPCRVVFGVDDDAWSPEEQREMAMRLGVEAVAVPDAVHSPAVENPAGTAEALLAFLRAAEGRPS